MAKRRGRRRGATTMGILPALGALGIVGVFIANDYGATGNSPLGYLLAGNWQYSFYSLSKNIVNINVLTVLIPGLIVLAGLFWIHKHYGAKSKISGGRKRWSLV